VESNIGVGLVRVLERGSVVTLGEFRHHPGHHRDPDEEWFEQPTVILPQAGTWGFESRSGAAEIHPGIVLIGAPGTPYRSDHEGRLPQDRSRFLTFHGLAPGGNSDGGSSDAILGPLQALERRVFRRPVAPRTMAIWTAERALEAAGRGSSSLRTDLIALQILVELAEVDEPEAPRGSGRVRTSALRERVDVAQAYIEQHAHEDVTLADVSRAAAVSPFHLSRLFKRQLGMSPHQYLVRVRIERAVRLLRETTLSVAQIASRVGYASPGHFAASFRQHVGVPPSGFRRWPETREEDAAEPAEQSTIGTDERTNPASTDRAR
jgi:AraC-like DNA-binding protein